MNVKTPNTCSSQSLGSSKINSVAFRYLLNLDICIKCARSDTLLPWTIHLQLFLNSRYQTDYSFICHAGVTSDECVTLCGSSPPHVVPSYRNHWTYT